MARRLVAVVIAALLVLSVVGFAVPAGAQSASTGPAGHSAAPADNFGQGQGQGQAQRGPPADNFGQGQGQGQAQRGPPEHANIPQHAAAWEIHSDRFADDLHTDVHADEQGRLALSFTDDVNHDGRNVAVRRATLAEAVGHEPETAYVEHSSGDTYPVSIDYSGEFATFDLREFSTNTVTFSGTVELTGDAASDGTTFSYELANDSVNDNFEIAIDGVLGETQRDYNFISNSGSSESVDIEGTQNPQSTVSIDGFESESSDKFQTDGSDLVVATDSTETERYTYEIENAPSVISSIEFDYLRYNTDGYSGTGSVTVYLKDGDVGNDVFNGDSLGSESGGHFTTVSNIDIDDFNSESETVTLGVEYFADDRSQSDYQKWEWRSDETITLKSGVPTGVQFDSQTDQTSNLEVGAESDIDLSTGTNEIHVQTTEGYGNVDWSLETTELTDTMDVKISVNGNLVEHDGILENGETVTLDVQESWINSGENIVEVSTSSGSLVGLDYSHDTSSQAVSTVVNSTVWAETITTNKTFVDSQQDAKATLQLSDSIVDIGEIEQNRGDGWQSATNYNYEPETNRLFVEFGDMAAGDSISVRADARKMRVLDGEIDVLQPTIEGDSLSTQFEITNRGDNFGIDVSGTSPSEFVHYVSERSWDATTDFAEIDSGGSQILRLPDANEGGVATIETAPLSVNVGSGKTGFVVLDGSKPEFRVVRAGSLEDKPNSIDVTWQEATPDQTYELFSITNDRVVTTSTANSPVTFTTDGTAQTYLIQLFEGSSSGTAVSVSGGGAAGPLSIFALFGGMAFAMFGSVYVGRRWLGFTTIRSNSLLLVVGSMVGFVAVELATERDILSDLLFAGGSAFSDALAVFFNSGAGPVVIGLTILLSIYLLDSRTRLPVPTWFYIVGGAITSIWTIDAISDGALTDSLGELGPLLWIMLLGGGGLLLWRALQPTIVEIAGESR